MTEKLVRIIVTSDTHAHWLNLPENPDASLLNTASKIQKLKAKPADKSITIDLGDFIQGSSFATYLNQERGDGKVLARAMNQIGYDYQLIGNHEFNFGSAYRDEILQELDTQILLSNIIADETGQVFMGKPYDIIEVAGIKIGIIGSTTAYIPNWELPQNYAGLSFVNAYEATKRFVDEVRPQVDLLIVAYHGGFERDLVTGEPLEELTKENQGSEMLAGIDGIDILLTGHQHRELNQQVGQTWVIQPGYAGEYVGEIEVKLKDAKITHMAGYLHTTADAEADQQLKAVMEPEFTEADDWLNTVLGIAPLDQVTDSAFEARVYGHPYIELLNQIQLAETGAEFSAIALINDSFKDFHGPITHEVLLKSYPYYNLIAKVNITGAELYEIIAFNYEYFTLNQTGALVVNPEYLYPKARNYNFDIYSGLQITVDMTQEPGQRIVKLVKEATGEVIDKEQTYSLAISQYRAVGGGDFKWFNKEKIESLSTIDIASLIPPALENFSPKMWERINTNYGHTVWLVP